MFHSIRWRVAVIFVVVVVVCMGGLGTYMVQFVNDSYLEHLRAQSINQAYIAGNAAQPYLNGQQNNINDLVQRLGNNIDARITIIDTSGIVLGDSEMNAQNMENHGNRPEVKEALSGQVSTSIRYSTTLNYRMMYVAVPITVGEQVNGVVRIALPLDRINESLSGIRQGVIIGIIATALVAVLAAFWVSRTTTGHLKELTRMSKKVAGGELNQKIYIASRDEVRQLADAFNLMTARISETVAALTAERDKMTAILSTMTDGIFIVDSQRRITLVNRAATRLLKTPESLVEVCSFIEVIHDHELDSMLRRCLESGEQQRGTVEAGSDRRFLGVTVTPLGDGALMLVQDLTGFRKMEIARRDLVSNISHELRTPISSIKAITETLQEGAINDKQTALKFLKNMSEEVDRLAQMVSELTKFSGIESGEVAIKLEPLNIGETIRHVADRLKPQAERNGLTIALKIPEQLPRPLADREKFENVLINLVHNAIKFTPPEGEVEISARSETGKILVSVRDTGTGISPDDLPRIFERFYKGAKARSGGGDGLGLAIAKHIIRAHNGEIWAESEFGKGSTFTFSLPLSK